MRSHEQHYQHINVMTNDNSVVITTYNTSGEVGRKTSAAFKLPEHSVSYLSVRYIQITEQ